MIVVVDFNGDGIDDIFISAPQYAGFERRGKVFILKEERIWPRLHPERFIQQIQGEITLQGHEKDALLGSIITGGNFNGDGFKGMLWWTHFVFCAW
ncbi:MAG: integrin alpha [candidate division KSB1 bacterium]|nr:integrin alpha [candidate division KSB1 bacterium]